MISFTSILTAIKGTSLAAKVGFGVGAVAVVAGSTAGTVAIINASRTHEETQIVASSPNDDNSPSEQEDTQIGEAGEPGEPEDDNNESEQVTNTTKPTTNINDESQTTTQKPSSSSASNSQSNNSSSSKPSTPTTQPSQPSQPSTPNQPSQPTQPTKKPDYNLNDKYVAGTRSYPFWTLDENGQCVVAEEKSFFGIARFTGQGDDLWSATLGQQYMNYANSKGYNTMDCLGMGSAPTTWEAVVSVGLALDEAKCAQYGLSCGRW